jgi:hypothetical protein
MIGIGRTARNVFGLANVASTASCASPPTRRHGVQLVSYISHHMALKPGDVSFTGTREDVIPAIPKTNRSETGRQGIDVTIEKLGKPTFTLNLR